MGFGLGGSGGPPLEPLRQFLTGDSGPALFSVWGAAIAVLLLACGTTASLELARGVRRKPEYAVRLALGATRFRLVYHAAMQSLVPVAAACAIGVGLAYGFGSWVRTLVRSQIGLAAGPSPGWLGSAGLTVLLIGLVTLLCAAAPAWQAASVEPNRCLMMTGPGSASRRASLGAREFLSVAQVCLALVLLAAAGWLLRGTLGSMNRPRGFVPQGLAVISAQMPPVPELTAARRTLSAAMGHWTPAVAVQMTAGAEAEAVRDTALTSATQQALRALPGAAAIGTLDPEPFGKAPAAGLQIYTSDPAKYDFVRSGIPPVVNAEYVSGNAFRMLGLRLLGGRTFRPSDLAQVEAAGVAVAGSGNSTTARPVPVVVNAAFAAEFWPGRSALGKSFFAPFPCYVIGVVSDARLDPNARRPAPTVYQMAAPGTFSFLVRLRPGAAFSTFAAGAVRAMARLNSAMTPAEVLSVPAEIHRASQAQRLLLYLLACFAGLGLVAAALGVSACAQELALARRTENAIRAALGASPGDLYAAAARNALRVALLAVPPGALGAWLLARGLTHVLGGASGPDWVVFSVSAVALAALVLIAHLRLARSTAHADLAAVLRSAN